MVTAQQSQRARAPRPRRSRLQPSANPNPSRDKNMKFMKCAPFAFSMLLAVGIHTASTPAAGASPQATTRGAGRLHPGSISNLPPSPVPRMDDLLSGRPSVTAIRFDELGDPLVRFDVYFGGAIPAGQRGLLELLDGFEFGEPAATELKNTEPKDFAGPRLQARTMILPVQELPAGDPELLYFDPDNDVAISFRSIPNGRQALSCTQAVRLAVSFSYPTGANVYFTYTTGGSNFTGDMVSAAVGPNKNSPSDPDLYLYRWTGSAWVLHASSGAASTIDTVAGLTSNCTSRYWYVRVHMFAGGSCRAVVRRFNASS